MSGRAVLKHLLRDPTACAGLVILAFFGMLALLAPWLAPGDPTRIVGTPLQWPTLGSSSPLGIDSMGKDVLSGLLHGARVSIGIGLVATLIGIGLGVTVGALAGYFGGWVESILMRITEMFQTIPNFILLVVVVSIVGPSITTIILAIGAVSWTTLARLVRAEFRSVRAKEYIAAAQGLGYGHGRIILRHILPNVLSPIILTASIMVASAILTESALSFMGLGDPNAVTWGSMIGEGRQYLRSAWFLAVLPGVCIVLTVLSLNLFGDGLNDALNPRRHGSH